MNARKKNRNTGLKVLSVFFAVLLWLYVIGEGQNPARHSEREVNLKYHNVAEGFAVEGPDTVKVKTWGSEGENENIEAYLDLSGLGEGEYRLPVKVKTLKGALLTTVDPKEVTVRIKKIDKHVFSITCRTVGTLPDGYELLGLEVSPAACLVKGEEKTVSKVRKVVCEVNLSEMKGPGAVEVPLKAVDVKESEVKGEIRLLPAQATVYLVTGSILKMGEVAVNPVLEGSLETGYELGAVTAVPDKITVLGNPTSIEGWEKINTLPVSLEGKNASFSQKVKLVVPNNVKAYPDEVLVNIEIKKKENE